MFKYAFPSVQCISKCSFKGYRVGNRYFNALKKLEVTLISFARLGTTLYVVYEPVKRSLNFPSSVTEPFSMFVKDYTASNATAATAIPMRKKTFVASFKATLRGKKVTVKAIYNNDGTLSWQPIKVGTRWYMLKGKSLIHPLRSQKAATEYVKNEIHYYLRCVTK